ncbi:AFR746Cp [Eremothecium gossypii ATCC 10895]|uniref:AFR746Cp n=1 Tax=Eremothecium gossypii (strain ATCC 10895 / CBS 109.51 / FGSC 9923 / NRRL Y-1056) TaxID=284811 RepID=Q751S8_EREGS|nr:AFR746Cp [Eremothecium gossypii ATCC 10895]AAS54119.1 AFR746Cp [Eremothecium gossypii ATCC 10895]AEY98435.1 FAFR746Cp [Eremothecium gossypii FDAG1]
MDELQRTVLALQTRSDELVLQLRSSVVECERVGRAEICGCAVRAALAEGICDGAMCEARRWEFYALLMQLTSLRVRVEHISGTVRGMLRRGEWNLQAVRKQFEMLDALSDELDGLVMGSTPCSGLEPQGHQLEYLELKQLELLRLSAFSSRSELVSNRGDHQAVLRGETDRARGTRIREIAGDGRKLQNSRAPELVPGRVIPSNTSYDSSSLFRRSLDGHLSELFDISYHSDEETVVSINQQHLGDLSSVISPKERNTTYPKTQDLSIGGQNFPPFRDQYPITTSSAATSNSTAAVTYCSVQSSFGENSRLDKLSVTHGFLKSLAGHAMDDRQKGSARFMNGQFIPNISHFFRRWKIFSHQSMNVSEPCTTQPFASVDKSDIRSLHNQDMASQDSTRKFSTVTEDSFCSEDAYSGPSIKVTMTPVLYEYLKEALETELRFN